VQRSDGQNLTVDPNGQTWWSHDAGSWQRLFPQGGVWIAYREDTNREFYISRLPKMPYQS
jgi:hypothetical protein